MTLELDRTVKMFLVEVDALFCSTHVLCFNKSIPFVPFKPFTLCVFNVSSVILTLRTLLDALAARCFSPDAVNISAYKVKVFPVFRLENRALYIAVTSRALGLKLLVSVQ